MTFSEAEIAHAKELKRLGFGQDWKPLAGQYLFARHCPEGCIEIAPQIHLVMQPSPSMTENVWLPRMDDLLVEAKNRKISFSQITDFLHRRRFADRAEREGLMQLFIELLR